MVLGNEFLYSAEVINTYKASCIYGITHQRQVIYADTFKILIEFVAVFVLVVQNTILVSVTFEIIKTYPVCFVEPWFVLVPKVNVTHTWCD